MDVLKSNNWDKYRPQYILVEQKDEDVESITCSEVYVFLKEKGYKCVAKTLRTAIYKIQGI